MPNSDKVFIRDLEIVMSAGIHDHERANKQRVIINVELDVESNDGKDLESINSVVCYHKILNKITELAMSEHHDLLESFAEKIAKICVEHKLVNTATIRVEKPDIIPEVTAVGVEITRSKA